jgi:UDP-2,3-diacylglucosamine hydrolase
MSILFVSDLHLSAERPEKLDAFKRLFLGAKNKFDAIYILGDLFEEFWVGNDDTTPPNPEILNTLKTCSDAKVKIFLIRGNRELLLDENFTKLCGVTLLEDISAIKIRGKKILLMHGDQLCTLDLKYQLFRKFISNKIIKYLIRQLPYGMRIKFAHGLRPGMTRDKVSKTEEIMDVTDIAVQDTMLTHKARILIHGHTHKPGIHKFELANSPAERIVLGDWYRKGEVLIYTDDNFRFLEIEELLSEFV